MSYANFWARLAAFLLDVIILYIPNIILQTIVFSFFGVPKAIVQLEAATGSTVDESQAAEALAQFMTVFLPAIAISLVINLVVAWLYLALMESSAKQATLGKMALGIVVTDLNGGRISFARATGRYFSKAFLSSILLIGYIIAAFTEKKQALHDIIAGTLVVKRR
jgi:uncharacterized RDD family membrane protein YckC